MNKNKICRGCQYLLIAIVNIAIMLGCESEKIGTLSINKGNESVDNTEGTITVNVTSNTSWTVAEDSDWVTLSKTTGNGNETITISYSTNTTGFLRKAIVSFDCDSIQHNLIITQTRKQLSDFEPGAEL